MGRKDRKIREESRSNFRQFLFMNQRLHQMLRFLGQQQVKGTTIKLDEFQKLRQQFVDQSSKYQKINTKIKLQDDKVERAKLSKNIMEDSLKQMTTLVVKLNEKVKRQNALLKGNNSGNKKKNTDIMTDQIDPQQYEQQLSPIEKELQYKKLIVYTFQKSFFKLIGKERRQVNKIKRDINNKKYDTLEDFKTANLPVNRLLQQEQQKLEEKQILQALKEIDDMIEERADNLLQGIKVLHQNAINISDSLGHLHMKVMVNLDKIQHNDAELKRNQKRIDQASKVVSKPTCIINIVILVLLGLLGFLIVKLLWFSN